MFSLSTDDGEILPQNVASKTREFYAEDDFVPVFSEWYEVETTRPDSPIVASKTGSDLLRGFFIPEPGLVDVEPAKFIRGLWSLAKHDRAKPPALFFRAPLPLFVGRGNKLLPGFSQPHIPDFNCEFRLGVMGLSEPCQNIVATAPFPRGMDELELRSKRSAEPTKDLVCVWYLPTEPTLEELV